MMLLHRRLSSTVPAGTAAQARRPRFASPASSPPSAAPVPKGRRHATTTRAAASSNNSSNWLSNLRSRPPAFAAAVTGAYALIAGAALCAAPAPTLAIIAPAAAAAVPAGWVRVGGLILATFGAQYALASWHDCSGRCGGAEAFYRASVPSRLALAAALAALVAVGQVEPGVLVLAALNATGALSMRKALQRAAAGGGGSGVR